MKEVVIRYVNVYRRKDGSLKVGYFLYNSEEDAKAFLNEEEIREYVATKEIKIELI